MYWGNGCERDIFKTTSMFARREGHLKFPGEKLVCRIVLLPLLFRIREAQGSNSRLCRVRFFVVFLGCWSQIVGHYSAVPSSQPLGTALRRTWNWGQRIKQSVFRDARVVLTFLILFTKFASSVEWNSRLKIVYSEVKFISGLESEPTGRWLNSQPPLSGRFGYWLGLFASLLLFGKTSYHFILVVSASLRWSLYIRGRCLYGLAGFYLAKLKIKCVFTGMSPVTWPNAVSGCIVGASAMTMLAHSEQESWQPESL
jgi:hypothetical protein